VIKHLLEKDDIENHFRNLHFPKYHFNYHITLQICWICDIIYKKTKNAS